MPNTGFLEDVVFEDPVLVSSSQGLDSCEDAADASEDPENNIKNEEEGESEPNTVSTTEIDAKSGMAEEAIANVGDIKLEDDASANETNVEEPLALSVEDVDAYLDKCLLQALHTTVKDKDLPMPGSTLW